MTDDITKRELADRVEQLETELQEMQREQSQVNGLFERLKRGEISRRTFLTAASAVAGIGYAAGTVTAQTNPSWSDSTGEVGEEGTPLKYGYIRDLYTQSVSTEEGNISNLSTGTTKEYLTQKIDADTVALEAVQLGTSVDTSATTVLSRNETVLFDFIMVSGNAGTASFCDWVTVQRTGDVTVQFSETINSPAARSYSVSGGELQLAMASDTYRVGARSIGMRTVS